MRAFTAIGIESPEALEKLTEIQEQLGYGFNTVKPEKMHITLQFFQDIDKEEVQEIQQAMENTDLDKFNLQIKGVGVFPSKDHIRVVWAGVESEKIFELKQQVSKHQVQDDNEHKFHPHITLARVNKIPRNKKKQFMRKLQELEQKKIAQTTVSSIKLFKSTHNGRSTEYKTLKEKKL